MTRIRDDKRRVVMPMVDGLEAKTFEYSSGGIGCTLGNTKIILIIRRIN